LKDQLAGMKQSLDDARSLDPNIMVERLRQRVQATEGELERVLNELNANLWPKQA